MVVSPENRFAQSCFARWQTTVCNKAYQKRSSDHIRDTKRVYIGSPVHKVYMYRIDRVDLWYNLFEVFTAKKLIHMRSHCLFTLFSGFKNNRANRPTVYVWAKRPVNITYHVLIVIQLCQLLFYFSQFLLISFQWDIEIVHGQRPEGYVQLRTTNGQKTYEFLLITLIG